MDGLDGFQNQEPLRDKWENYSKSMERKCKAMGQIGKWPLFARNRTEMSQIGLLCVQVVDTNQSD